MTDSLTLLTCIIVHYKDEENLKRCIKSLRAQSLAKSKFKITVVDNNSLTDSEATTIKSLVDDFLPLPKNVGYGQAVNTAVREITTPFFVCLNTDVVLDEHCLAELLQTHQTNSKVFACNGTTYWMKNNKPTTTIQNAGIRILADGRGKDRDSTTDSDHRLSAQSEVDACCGVCMAMRMDVFKRLKGFDPDFFMYYEDVELSTRARKQGYTCVHVPSAKLWHMHAQTSGEGSPFFLYQTERGHLLYVLKHLSWKQAWMQICYYLLRQKLWALIVFIRHLRHSKTFSTISPWKIWLIRWNVLWNLNNRNVTPYE